jgi:hypothetical protein
MNDHAKTRAAVAVLVAAGVPAEYAGPIIISAMPRLSAWALSDGDTGRTGCLSDARFAAVAWPESVDSRRFARPHVAGALIRKALRSVPAGHETGYLEGEGHEERIHDFCDIYYDVLKNRRDAKGSRERRGFPATSATTAATGSATPSRTGSRTGNATPPGGSVAAATATAAASQIRNAEPPAAALQPSGPQSEPPDENPTSAAGSSPETPERGYARADRRTERRRQVADRGPREITPEVVGAASRLASRIGGPAHPLVESMLAELVEEGIDLSWLLARIDATAQAGERPFTWGRTAREAWRADHPGADPNVERERSRARRDAHRWTEKALEAEADAATVQAAGGTSVADLELLERKRSAAASWWRQACDAAKVAGIDPDDLRKRTALPS